jgi:hypothetical protein
LALKQKQMSYGLKASKQTKHFFGIPESKAKMHSPVCIPRATRALNVTVDLSKNNSPRLITTIKAIGAAGAAHYKNKIICAARRGHNHYFVWIYEAGSIFLSRCLC